MSFQSGIFNSTHASLTPEGLIRGDKAVDAAFIARIFHSFFEDGVFLNGDGGGFAVSVAAGAVGDLTAMTVITAPGACHIGGYFGFEDEEQMYTFPVSSEPQVFCHVIRLDGDEGRVDAFWCACTESGGLLVRTGGEVLPVRSGGVFDLVTAKVRIPGGACVIRPEYITDLRADRAFCGVVAGAVTGFDTAAWCAQMRAYLTALERTVSDLPADSAAYFALNKLNADLSNLSAHPDPAAAAILAGAHVHPAEAIGGGVLGADVTAADGGDLRTARLRNIAFADRIPDSAAGLADGALLGVYA